MLHRASRRQRAVILWLAQLGACNAPRRGTDGNVLARKLISGALATAALAGCGSSSSTTVKRGPAPTAAAPTSTAQLEGVCREYSPKLNALGRQWGAVSDKTTLPQLNALGARTNVLFSQTIRAIQEIPEPQGATAPVAHWVNDLGDANTAINGLVKAADQKNAQGINQEAQRFTAAMSKARQDRIKLDVKSC